MLASDPAPRSIEIERMQDHHQEVLEAALVDFGPELVDLGLPAPAFAEQNLQPAAHERRNLVEDPDDQDDFERNLHAVRELVAEVRLHVDGFDRNLGTPDMVVRHEGAGLQAHTRKSDAEVHGEGRSSSESGAESTQQTVATRCVSTGAQKVACQRRRCTASAERVMHRTAPAVASPKRRTAHTTRARSCLKHAVVKRKLDVDRARVLVQPPVFLQRLHLVLVQLGAVGQRQERREPVVLRRERECVSEVAERGIVARFEHVDWLGRRRRHARRPRHFPVPALLVGVVRLDELVGIADFVEVLPANQHVVVHHKASLVGCERVTVVPFGREDIRPNLILQTAPHVCQRERLAGMNPEEGWQRERGKGTREGRWSCK
eukprot:3939498-Rhodomonas_salina.5